MIIPNLNRILMAIEKREFAYKADLIYALSCVTAMYLQKHGRRYSIGSAT
jgi:hypothetical protein